MPTIARQDEFIRSLGVEAYRVGGSVRDEILGRPPKDADYIVCGVDLDALLNRIVAAHPFIGRKINVKPLVDRQGQQFGWRVQSYLGIEISLPRKEADAGSGRKQIIEVDPDLSLAEDAKRRDFTFNAIYRSVDALHSFAVIDPTGTGVSDLRRRIIRTTHPDSFRDDPLRMLRALRFVSTLDADLAGETVMQMKLNNRYVQGLTHKGHTSGTVYDEFSKLLMGQQPSKALRLAVATGVLPIIMPELAAMIGFDQGSAYHDLSTDEHTFAAIETAAHVDASLRVRWALLFHDSGKPFSAWVGDDGRTHYYASPSNGNWDHEEVGEDLWREAAKRMNVPRRFTDDVATIIREHMVSDKHRAPQVWVNRKRVQLGDELLRDLLLHRSCDFAGKKAHAVAGIQHMAALESRRAGAQQAKVPTSIKDLQINGADCMAEGLQGRNIGAALKTVLDEVVCDPTPLKLSREWQLRRIA